MNSINRLLNNMIGSIQEASWLLVVFISLTAIAGIIVFCCIKLKKIPTLAIILSTLVSCLIMIPVVTSLNHVIQIKAEKVAKQLKTQASIESLETQNSDLQKQIDLLQNAQISIQSWQEICKVELLETRIKDVDVQMPDSKILTPDPIWFGSKADKIMAQATNEQYLFVQTHDINAKFGIDFDDITVEEQSDGSLLVYGIQSKYLGSDRNITKKILTERRVKSNYISNIDGYILGDGESIKLAYEKADEAERRYQENLAKSFSFMDSSVEKVAQNYIKVILAPLGIDINFADRSNSSLPQNRSKRGVKLMDYLNTRIENCKSQMR